MLYAIDLNTGKKKWEQNRQPDYVALFRSRGQKIIVAGSYDFSFTELMPKPERTLKYESDNYLNSSRQL